MQQLSFFPHPPKQSKIWPASNHHLPPEQCPDYESWAADKIKRMMPLNRWIEAEDVAAMAVF